MAFTKKTWKDRISEYPTRRQLTKTDGSTDTVTVARDEGTISQEGDAFSAENMNDLEERIAGEFGNVNTDLGGNSLIYNESEDAYYIRHGADAVPKKLGKINEFGLISLPYRAGSKTFTIDTTGKKTFYYVAGIGTRSSISITHGTQSTNVTNDSKYVKSSDFAKNIVTGINLLHSIDVENIDSIILNCFSYAIDNENCDFIYSLDKEIAKLESDYFMSVE